MGEFSPLKAIINPPGLQSVMPGETLELHAVVMNQGDRSAIIDVYLDEAFQIFSRSPVSPQERVALAAGQSTEVSFQVEIPIDMHPGTYDYNLVIDAPEHYPQDTPIQYPRQTKILLKEQTIVREFDPTFSLEPTSNPIRPIDLKPDRPLQITISVDNRSRRVDSFRLTCPDLEAEWFTIQYPQTGVEGMGLLAQGNRLELNPATVGQIVLMLHPPVDALAGSYALTLRLQSENSPDLVLLDVVYLQIPTVHRLDVSLNTVLGRVSRSPGRYELNLANLGNTPRQVDLSAKTRTEDELCSYKFNPIPIKLLPSKSTLVELTVTPNKWWRRPLFGAGLPIEFQVDLQDRDDLPLVQPTLPALLIWQSRPWWQFLSLLLIALGLLGGLGFIAWNILHPPSIKIAKLELRNQKIDENDWGLLSWKIDEFARVQKISIATIGAVPEKREYNIAQLTDPNRTKDIPDCITEDRSLVCENFKILAGIPGEYTFELKLLDRSNNVIETKTSEKLTVVPKPEPELIGFTVIPPNKLKYAQGESILVNWTVQYLQKLAAFQVIAKAEDGSIPIDLLLPIDKSIQDRTCTQVKEKQQIICSNFPIKISQAGKYELQIKPISKTPPKAKPQNQTTAPVPPLKIEVLPKQLKIVEFAINGTSEPSRIVKEGAILTITWKVEGDEKMNVELVPGGTVPRAGTLAIPSIPSISQITLTATDTYGGKAIKTFFLKVEPVVVPTPNQIPNTTPNITPSPLPNRTQTPNPNLKENAPQLTTPSNKTNRIPNPNLKTSPDPIPSSKEFKDF
jgi:uncharacterized membrane protein